MNIQNPHQYMSLIEAVLAGATSTGNPVLSQPWLGRPFILTDEAWSWGRYIARAESGTKPQSYRTRDPEQLAVIFCHLLWAQSPDDVQNFKCESMTLSSYSKAFCSVHAALRAVFDAAKPLHHIQEVRFDYVGEMHGAHLARVWDEQNAEYHVVFDEGLVLQSIEEMRLGRKQVWPNT